jgi:hypothetical protein
MKRLRSLTVAVAEVPLYDIKIRRIGWAGNIVRVEDERISRKVGNFVVQGQWGNHEQDGRTPSGWTHRRP